MIEVSISRNSNGLVNGLTITGHAGYADFGEDIVCAGVSALAQTCVLGLKEVVKIDPVVAIKAGFFSMELPREMSKASSDKAICLLETFCLGIEDIAKSYPSHILVRTTKEV